MALAKPPSNPLAPVTSRLQLAGHDSPISPAHPRTRAIVREFLTLGFGIPAFGVISLALMVAALTFGTFPLALIPPPLALIPASLALMTDPLTAGKPRRRLAEPPLPLAVQSFFHATQSLNTLIYR
jgi:hypothetical protein